MSNLPFKLGVDILGEDTYIPPVPPPSTTAPRPPTDPRAWTVFDPKVRLDEHSHETAHIVVATYLPTGQQASCGDFPHMIQNRVAAIERLKLAVAGQ